ncbi:MAG TPA: site-specific integrase [Candidatus Hydrogenedentes bacterium]|nr:site-specific integrase [Candidatus Hydrogenedentota bacterium]
MRMGLRPIPKRSEGLVAYSHVAEEYLDWGNAQGGRQGGPWGATHARMRTRHLRFWGHELALESVRDLVGSLARVERILRELKRKGRAGKTLSNYSESLCAFSAWCVDREYLEENPLRRLKPVDTTPVSNRRALTVEELRRLLQHAAPERALLYSVACVTGLRASELASLTVRSLDVHTCALRLDAAHTKNRKPGLQPLPESLMLTLLDVANLKHENEPLLEVPLQTAREMEKDLKAAGIPKTTDEGKVDFHALRTAFATMVFEEGASVKEGQTLMRHADPNITMNTYARTRDERLASITDSIANRIGIEEKCAIDVQSHAMRPEGKTLNTYSERRYAKKVMVREGGIEPPSPEGH